MERGHCEPVAGGCPAIAHARGRIRRPAVIGNATDELGGGRGAEFARISLFPHLLKSLAKTK